MSKKTFFKKLRDFSEKNFYALENFVKRGYIFVNINYLYKLFV